jgi:renalase
VTKANNSKTPRKRIAVVGAGMAGVVAARTLERAGFAVDVFEKSRGAGGRMSTRESPFGGFDHGAQYFTVRDPRFAQVLQNPGLTPSELVRPWANNAVRVLDPLGRVLSAAPVSGEAHFVAKPGMNALLKHWAGGLTLHTHNRVTAIERDPLHSSGWQLRVQPEGAAAGNIGDAHPVYPGYDAVLLAIPPAQCLDLLRQGLHQPRWEQQLQGVQVAPCWTLMVAYPQAMQAGINSLGPQWSAARSTHHRIAWLARESSKPGRAPVERWTVQASADWSREHLEDDAARVSAKLLKAFAEITGIRAQPSHVQAHRWRYAKTVTSLGQSHLWDGAKGLGLAGDWCLGHRVEDAFVSGLSLALDVAVAHA